ncbi:hypothetical protein [uncultured Victivallis sp.]|uniref:hypothetical protein n=1 Tax=uncultured Victivallis sp. TaxID=354118 RepID=UPI0025DC70EA|nr:hypothetical protein [uncultured Victivallis sp.]
MVRSLLLTGCVALFCVAGCIDFEYVGREFEPTPISDPVTYYVNREQLPPGEFRIMGRAEISAPDGTDGYDIQELLLEKARAFGADAVCLVSARKVPVGYYPREEVNQGPQFPLDPANVDFPGAPEPLAAELQEFGQPQTLSSTMGTRLEVEVKALFLKKKTELERLTAEQDQELDEILGEPSEPSRQAVPKKDVPPDAEVPDAEVQEAEEGIPAASADDAAPVPVQE